jgi:hydroxymethylbilane synthase
VSRTFRIGTRGSRLALAQTQIALTSLRAAAPGATFETRTIQTTGDRTSASLAEIGGRGVFVIEIERALLAGEIDIAVHSLKDLPTDETPGLLIPAVLPRDDPRDVLVSPGGSTLAELAPDATVGTGSPRRAAQVLALRPDIEVRDIRGNVDTRVRKADDGDYDAVILAAAGLNRLGIIDRASQIFEPHEMLPAPGQGILALQTRLDDTEAVDLVARADDPATRAAAIAERSFERRLGGGCHAAIAALATLGVRPNTHLDSEALYQTPLLIRGLVGHHPDPLILGNRRNERSILRGEMEGPAAEAELLGIRLAEYLIAQGAEDLLGAAI